MASIRRHVARARIVYRKAPTSDKLGAVAVIGAAGVLLWYLYGRKTTPVTVTAPLTGQAAPNTIISGTNLPPAAPAGYYYAKNAAGAYVLQPINGSTATGTALDLGLAGISLGAQIYNLLNPSGSTLSGAKVTTGTAPAASPASGGLAGAIASLFPSPTASALSYPVKANTMSTTAGTFSINRTAQSDAFQIVAPDGSQVGPFASLDSAQNYINSSASVTNTSFASLNSPSSGFSAPNTGSSYSAISSLVSGGGSFADTLSQNAAYSSTYGTDPTASSIVSTNPYLNTGTTSDLFNIFG